MAGLAGGEEAGGDVAGVGGGVERGLVTAGALAGGALEDAAGVAGRTHLSGVDADERVRRLVVEGALVPARVRPAVARLAGGGEAGGEVVGLGGGLVLGLVARDARRAHAGEHSLRVAGGAVRGQVSPLELPTGVCVAAGAPRGVGALVARRALRVEAGARVARVGRRLVLLQVAPRALARGALVDAAGVAREARLRGVHAEERKHGVVRELALRPRGVVGPVAGVAGGRESGGGVVRLRCRLVVGEMARDTRRAQPGVHGPRVAVGAVGCGVGALQLPAGVREATVAPRRVASQVTPLAVGGEAGGGVAGVGRGVEGRAMTTDAVLRRAVEDLAGVARRAWLRHVHADEREGDRVIELSLVPGGVRHAVAGLAVGGEPGRGVHRLVRRLVVGLVAGDAGRAGPRVDVVGVAGGAIRSDVRATQRPCRVLVAALVPGGVGGTVARLAVGREAGCRVARVGRGLVRGLVAANALACRALEDAAGVTVEARLGRVDALETERRFVVEHPVVPARVGDPVARLARGREPGSGMNGLARGLVVGLVAGEAVGSGAGVDVVGVAGGAVGSDVSSAQRPGRVLVAASVPRGVGGGVARLAVGREPGRRVAGIGRRVEGRLMAADALAGGALEDSAGVAGGARLLGVDTLQRIRSGVVEHRLRPGRVRPAVARLARGREAGGRVIGPRRSLVVGQMARDAGRAHAGVDVVGVASSAARGDVGALQRPDGVPVATGGPRRIGGLVARLAVRRETCGGVGGVVRGVIGRLVAAGALAGGAPEDAAGVAGRACLGGMDADEVEVGGVLERASGPAGVARGVAQGAVGWEASTNVRRHGRRLEVAAVARDALGRSGAEEDAAGVARLAVERAVGDVERVPGFGRVIPGHIRPRAGVVARLALVPQPGLVAVVVLANPVAIEASSGRVLGVAADVAGGTWHAQVRPEQRERGALVESPRRAAPIPGFVTRRAVGTETAGVRVLVARGARRRDAGEPHRGAAAGGKRALGASVAGPALRRSVPGDEEPGAALVGIGRNGEARDSVARLAALAELTEVDVLVARRAFVRDAAVAHRVAGSVRVHRALGLVTARAGYGGVLAGERETRGGVREAGRGEAGRRDRVAAGAVAAELAEVDVLVARGAVERHAAVAARRDRRAARGAVGRSGVAARAGDRGVAAGEELGRAGVGERGHRERRGRVTALARPAQRTLVDVGVARQALGLQPPELDGRGRARRGRRGAARLLVARHARGGGVFSRQCKLRLRGVVERRALEGSDGVAGAAVGRERAAVDVPVAARAAGGVGAGLHRRLRVARGAGHGGVSALERVARPRVVDPGGLPCRSGVAGRAVGSEALPVGIGVTIGAGAELEVLVRLLDVALGAGDGTVRARERKWRGAVVERLRCRSERRGGAVAARTVGAEHPEVDVLVARGALRTSGQVGARRVALGAVAGDPGVPSVERVTGLGGVVESTRIERAQLGVGAGVLDVTGDAVVGDVAVDALPGSHALADRQVAGEAPRGRDLLAGLVALLAVLQPFELGMCRRERARRDEGAELLGGRRRRAGGRRDEDGERGEESPTSRPGRAGGFHLTLQRRTRSTAPWRRVERR